MYLAPQLTELDVSALGSVYKASESVCNMLTRCKFSALQRLVLPQPDLPGLLPTRDTQQGWPTLRALFENCPSITDFDARDFPPGELNHEALLSNMPNLKKLGLPRWSCYMMDVPKRHDPVWHNRVYSFPALTHLLLKTSNDIEYTQFIDMQKLQQLTVLADDEFRVAELPRLFPQIDSLAIGPPTYHVSEDWLCKLIGTVSEWRELQELDLSRMEYIRPWLVLELLKLPFLRRLVLPPRVLEWVQVAQQGMPVVRLRIA